MASISESSRNQSLLAAALRDGLEQLDLNQKVRFQGYTRVVLPLDKYIFWQPTVEIVVKGSLHFSQEIQQREDETVGFATVLFTSEQPIVEFASAPTNTLWVARQGEFRYAFSQQQGFYSAAALWHYMGHSVYPALASQLLDAPGTIDPDQAVVTNSLPAWLAMSKYQSPYSDWFSNPITLYPSFMVAPNLEPPYGAVHIGQADTRSLQTVPWLSVNRSSYQLAVDKVRITLYGLQNNAAVDFLNFVIQWCENNPDTLGLMNMPIVMDGKRPQEELETIAMQKVIDFEVSYHQTRIAEVARQLIASVGITYNFPTNA